MEFRKNEETGAIERQVVNYEAVERDSLVQEIENKETEINVAAASQDELYKQVESIQAQIMEKDSLKVRLEAELTSLKSGLQSFDSVAGTESEPVHDGAEAPSPEDTPAVEAEQEPQF